MSTAHDIAKVVRHELLRTATRYKRKKVAVALSGGVDSCSVLASLLAVGIKPLVVSYTPHTHESTDYTMAKSCAATLGLEFVRAEFPMTAGYLESCAREVIRLGYTTKVEVECLTPMWKVSETAWNNGARVLFTGDQADGFFSLSKWASHNADRAAGVPRGERTNVQLDTTPDRIDHLRNRYWALDKSCSGGVQKLGATWGLEVVVPYRNLTIHQAFLGSLWSEVNKPRAKEPLRLAFEEWLCDIPTRKLPVNLHKGDSEFAATMGKTLMAQPHLQGAWKTPTGLYAAMARGDV
jgi:asparagine synthetase B (glutamine-hydrolysing)